LVRFVRLSRYNDDARLWSWGLKKVGGRFEGRVVDGDDDKFLPA
jgi:hypothetical protein